MIILNQYVDADASLGIYGAPGKGGKGNRGQVGQPVFFSSFVSWVLLYPQYQSGNHFNIIVRATEAIMEAIKEMGETCLPGATQKTQWELG